MHEGRNQLARLMSEVESVLEVANLRSTSRHRIIEDLVSTLMKRLQDSTEIFEFRRIVREGISQYGESRFSLVDTIRDLVSHCNEQGYDVQYRSLLKDHVHPELPAADSPDPTTGVSPEYYLEQALEKVLDNAVHHGASGAAITVSLGMENGDAGGKGVEQGRACGRKTASACIRSRDTVWRSDGRNGCCSPIRGPG